MIISLDTETTGLDIKHGAKAFLVTTCNEEGTQKWWEWDVDPLTRQPKVVAEDLEEIQETIDDAEQIVLQNAKFDVAALKSVFGKEFRWDWSKVRDTLIAGHLLASNQPHDLTSVVLIYLGINVKPYDDKIKEITNQARRIARKEFPDWRIAKAGLPEMPSAKATVWKNDMWLPRALVKATKDPTPKFSLATPLLLLEWETACADYANSDSATTLPLYIEQRKLLKEKKLWKIYKERLKLLPIVHQMESHGITLSGKRLAEQVAEYTEASEAAGKKCSNIAESFGQELVLPKSGNNKSLTSFVFGEDGLNLEPVKVSKKTGVPSLDATTMEEYEATLPNRSAALSFVRALRGKRKRDTALSYMEAYQRFWKPLERGIAAFKRKDWYKLYPSLNPTGTDTLRWSSQNPNSQNISKKEGFNLRYAFGPAPGREWWSCDAKNIELRLPAYECGETEMIALFEKPDEAPFFGSNHLFVFSILHPEKFRKYGADVKKKYASTWYQWTKNGNFAVQYGAIIPKNPKKIGTADRAYHVPGAQAKVQSRFKQIAKLNQRMIAHAKEFGFVETIPDRTIDPDRGYPLYCTRTSYGQILPTVPLNYHIQGTAMWWMGKAMIRCQKQIDKWNKKRKPNQQIHMVLQVHDELVFDFPSFKIRTSKVNLSTGKAEFQLGNLPEVKTLMALMEKGGDDLGIPTPVSCEYHPNNWSEGISV